MDGFLQAIPDHNSSQEHPNFQEEYHHDLKVQTEVSSEEEVSISNGYQYPYADYEEDAELCNEGRKLWNEIDATQNRKISSVKVLLLNLQLKDDSTEELSEISSMNEVSLKIMEHTKRYHHKFFYPNLIYKLYNSYFLQFLGYHIR